MEMIQRLSAFFKKMKKNHYSEMLYFAQKDLFASSIPVRFLLSIALLITSVQLLYYNHWFVYARIKLLQEKCLINQQQSR